MNHKTFWVAGLLATLLVGCDEPSPQVSQPTAVTQAPDSSSSQGQTMNKQEQFLARIRQSSAGNDVILDARMNGDNELGVVLGPQVKLDQVRPLMTALLREMRDEFPNRTLLVIAYASNGQPMATMNYDPTAPADENVTFKSNF